MYELMKTTLCQSYSIAVTHGNELASKSTWYCSCVLGWQVQAGGWLIVEHVREGRMLYCHKASLTTD